MTPRPSTFRERGGRRGTTAVRWRAVLGPIAVAAALTACGGGEEPGGADGGADPARGQELFAANCAVCHGSEGQGAVTGPPLVHQIYEPGHHSDESFHQAVTEGVAPHHWSFGPMPPVAGLDRGDVDDIIAYVRSAQREAGIIE